MPEFRKRRWSIFDIFDELLRDLEERLESVDEDIEKEFKRMIEERREEIRGPYFYGIRITIGPNGVPRVEEFGNISRGRRGRPLIKEEIEPLVDVIERDDEIWIIADVPGVSKENIDVKVSERAVTIKARSEERKYHKIVDLPAEVAPETAKANYRNGVLEVKVKKKKQAEDKEFKVKIE
ncbi:MAG: Hsp20/alpha crystallin family protein [Thermoprotei archaeon]|nr:Hsp20/alpha crystallin family protein [Thermoprotei archaeon]